MDRLKLTKDQFEHLVTALVGEINSVQPEHFGYDLEFSNDGKKCQITPRISVLYTLYISTWEALTTIYSIEYWVEVQAGKPCIMMINEY